MLPCEIGPNDAIDRDDWTEWCLDESKAAGKECLNRFNEIARCQIFRVMSRVQIACRIRAATRYLLTEGRTRYLLINCQFRLFACCSPALAVCTLACPATHFGLYNTRYSAVSR